MKLVALKKILRIQLAIRTDCCQDQGMNVCVQVGSSPQYNADDQVCKEIDQLSGFGLVGYELMIAIISMKDNNVFTCGNEAVPQV